MTPKHISLLPEVAFTNNRTFIFKPLILIRENNVRAHGIEIDERAIYECVALGIGVSHQDIDNGLSEYGDQSFDYVIMNQSLQQVKKPDTVLKEARERRQLLNRFLTNGLIHPIFIS